MVQGMAFLSKKGFNPHNRVNRTQVYEAQQHSKLEKERVRKRQDQLKKEREDEEFCAARHNGDGSQAQLRFMYDAPPGMKEGASDQPPETDAKDSSDMKAPKDVTQAQPGDDAAAAAFRRMLGASNSKSNADAEAQGVTVSGEAGESKLGFSPVLQGSSLEIDLEKSNDTRSALEKAVGRRDRGSVLTLEEQVARFPQLKNAPMAKGMSATDVNVSFKPLGAQLRNVKCLACGVWGHSRGDRECKMTGWDPFSSSGIRAVASSTSTSTSIRPTKAEDQKEVTSLIKNSRHEDQYPGNDSDSSSKSSRSEDSCRRLRHKQKSMRKRKDRESFSRRRRHRSESPPRRSRSSKPHRKKRSRKHD